MPTPLHRITQGRYKAPNGGNDMAYRKKMRRNRSQSEFKRGTRTKGINVNPRPMRGGIRL